MRPGGEFLSAPTAAPAHAVNGMAATHSPWQSPVPYLFGGLAAMLGLIAFALLILACSYWKLSGYLDGDSANDQAGSTAAGEAEGEKGSAAGAARPAVGFQEHVVVIMAGDERPTFLAMPVTSRSTVELGNIPVASSCGDGSCSEEDKKVDESCEAGTIAVSWAGQIKAMCVHVAFVRIAAASRRKAATSCRPPAALGDQPRPHGEEASGRSPVGRRLPAPLRLAIPTCARRRLGHAFFAPS
ncbi:hypothetical protein E2562_018278 [Oryza meyeriana var. granulata]|uniref:Protein GLUTAMINE DUMPER 3 n=1 Tax=Oryza meyeriana var. granulata TaxID=110450 RepID=A0A6G1CRB6_9ORYZ|nr:hypothetical protein E2562_018278 [Oryza meyeriana var. granulata]